jgi:hypothetical protein
MAISENYESITRLSRKPANDKSHHPRITAEILKHCLITSRVRQYGRHTKEVGWRSVGKPCNFNELARKLPHVSRSRAARKTARWRGFPNVPRGRPRLRGGWPEPTATNGNGAATTMSSACGDGERGGSHGFGDGELAISHGLGEPGSPMSQGFSMQKKTMRNTTNRAMAAEPPKP